METRDVDLVISEYRIRWSDGLEILRTVKHRWPNCVVIMLTRTGSEEITVEAMKAGKVIRLFGTAQDITERKLAEEELRKQKEILEKIFDHIPIMITFIGADGRLKLVNREGSLRLGWSLEEIERQNLDVFAECYPDPKDCKRARDFVSGAKGEWADFKTRARDGRVIDTSWTNVHLSDGTSIGIGQDITGRKRAEQDLQRNLQRLAIQAEITASISSTLNLRDVLELLSEKINLLLPYSATSIRLVNKDTGNLEPAACRNFDEEEWKAIYSRGKRGLSWLAYETKAPLIIYNVQTIHEPCILTSLLKMDWYRYCPCR